MNIGIIGAGLVGRKRAKALAELNAKLVFIADTIEDRAKILANQYGCKYTTEWRDVVNDDSVDIIIDATIHKHLAEIAVAAIKNDKHVLIEKPAGMNLGEIEHIMEASKRSDVKVKVGYNHRFHPAVMKAKEICDSGKIGKLMFVEGVYGHGGRKDYDKEWRASKDLAGGGELLDQGSHLIDLSKFFMGNFSSVIGYTTNSFWNMEVEDNCFALLKNEKDKIAFLHASWTQWKNIFSFKIFMETGQLNIDGLGGSYGTETLNFYKMKPEFGIPDKQIFEFPGEDLSWKLEFQNLLDAINHDLPINGTLQDAYDVMQVVEKIYKWNEQHKNGT
jgi:predicted dehydrogenase